MVFDNSGSFRRSAHCKSRTHKRRWQGRTSNTCYLIRSKYFYISLCSTIYQSIGFLFDFYCYIKVLRIFHTCWYYHYYLTIITYRSSRYYCRVCPVAIRISLWESCSIYRDVTTLYIIGLWKTNMQTCITTYYKRRNRRVY